MVRLALPLSYLAYSFVASSAETGKTELDDLSLSPQRYEQLLADLEKSLMKEVEQDLKQQYASDVKELTKELQEIKQTLDEKFSEAQTTSGSHSGLRRHRRRLGPLDDLEDRIDDLEDITACVKSSSDDKEFILEGCNVIIRNNEGNTDDIDGYGNLIIGYNEGGSSCREDCDRDGSHNIVIGKYHEWTSYGGIVAGYANFIDAPYASVLGGRLNSATGRASTVTAGYGNKAEADYSSISGGKKNTIDDEAEWASISGGLGNKIMNDGEYGSISGGKRNEVDAKWASVLGGEGEEADSNYETIPEI